MVVNGRWSVDKGLEKMAEKGIVIIFRSWLSAVVLQILFFASLFYSISMIDKVIPGYTMIAQVCFLCNRICTLQPTLSDGESKPIEQSVLWRKKGNWFVSRRKLEISGRKLILIMILDRSNCSARSFFPKACISLRRMVCSRQNVEMSNTSYCFDRSTVLSFKGLAVQDKLSGLRI